MRRWYFLAIATLALVSVAGLSPFLLSSSDPQDGKKADQPQGSKNAQSKISRVTVYPNSALVTREIDVPAGDGLIELVVTSMPEQIVPSTMYSEGSEGVRVLTTRFRTQQVFEDTSVERRKLEAEKEKLQVIASKINSEIESIQKNLALLNKLENFADKSTVLSAEKGGLNSDTVITLAKYVMEERGARAKEMVVAGERKRLNDQQMEFCNRKMSELGGGGGRQERDAVVVVDREAGKGGRVRLNYLVSGVTWRPEYKLRSGKMNEDVEVDYLANLKQNSGEDWGHVELTLSTAQPMLNAAPPELAMLEPVLVARGVPGGLPMPSGATAPAPYANAFAPAELLKKARAGRDEATRLNAGLNLPMGGGGSKSGGTGTNFGTTYLDLGKNQKDADKLLNDASAVEQNLELQRSREEIIAQLKKTKTAPAAASNDGPSVSYHLPSKLTVPSRNDEQVVEVVKFNLAPKYYHKTVPVLNHRVYRLADLVNKSDFILLPGEATMYTGTDFVGRMPMPLVAIGEEFTVGFGVDTQLQVQRQMVDQNRTMQGGNQVLKYEYRILVSSFKSEPVKLQIWDRLPKADTESVNVILVKTSPELSKDGIYQRESRPNNLLRWDLEVAPNRNGEKAVPITYEFRLELDRQMAITGFQSR
jgi:hypothetical protein